MTNSYFSKNFGNPDINTFSRESFRNSRFVRVGSDGILHEEIALPDFMLWDGVYNYDPMKCYGNRVMKGLHALSYFESPNPSVASQLVLVPQFALYQDGPESSSFDGSQTRILFWDTAKEECTSDVKYSHSFRYETSRKEIQMKGAHHVKGIFAALPISSTELLVSETEFYEGFGKHEHFSDVFYVTYEAGDTVDHCDSLMNCDVPVPQKRHLLRRNHPYELSGITWGPTIEKDGETHPSLVMSFEDDDQVGILLEQYLFDASNLDLEPLWDNNVSIEEFLMTRYLAVGIGLAIFVLGVALQHYWLSKEGNTVVDSRSHIQRGGDAQESTCCGFKYKDYVLVSAVVNSCLLGGVVFGFPGLVLILRQEGVYAENCSCGQFCSGQREQMAMLSTLGFASAIGSRLFAGLVLDKFGPKITSVLAGLLSTVGFLLLATTENTAQLSQFIQPAWIILALGGAAIHLTSFHTTNL